MKLAQRTNLELNAIRKMFQLCNKLNRERALEGLPPLLSLGIGAPHVPANPLLAVAAENYAKKKNELNSIIYGGNHSDEEVQKATKELVAMDTYVPAAGKESTRQALARLMNYYYDIGANEENIIVTVGATNASFALFSTFVEPGVTVAFFTPYFPPYRQQVEILGGNVVEITFGDDGRPSMSKLEAALKENTISALIVNDPCNPSGIKWTNDELKALAEIMEKKENENILIISDETYKDIIFRKDQDMWLNIINRETLLYRTACIFSGAKGLAGAPSLRGGFIYVPDKWRFNGEDIDIHPILTIQELNLLCNVPAIVQDTLELLADAKVGVAKPEYCEMSKKWEEMIMRDYSENAKIVMEKFTAEQPLACVNEPGGGFFTYVDAKSLLGKTIPERVEVDGRVIEGLREKIGKDKIEIDVDIARYFVYAAEVVVIPSSGFAEDPNKGRIRISLCVSSEGLKAGIERLFTAIKHLE